VAEAVHLVVSHFRDRSQHCGPDVACDQRDRQDTAGFERRRVVVIAGLRLAAETGHRYEAHFPQLRGNLPARLGRDARDQHRARQRRRAARRVGLRKPHRFDLFVHLRQVDGFGEVQPESHVSACAGRGRCRRTGADLEHLCDGSNAVQRVLGPVPASRQRSGQTLADVDGRTAAPADRPGVLETLVQAHHQDDVVPRLVAANDVHDLQFESLDSRIAVIGQAIRLHPLFNLIDLDVPLAVPVGLGRFLPRGRRAQQSRCQQESDQGAVQGATESGLFCLRLSHCVHPQHASPFQWQ